MFVTLIAIFIAGIILIALEDKVKINKTASALLMASVSWTIVSLYGGIENVGVPFVHQLGETSQTLFFVLGALAIIELIDTHGGFRVVTNLITTTNKRKLLWIVSIMTFILSAILDNIATAVIMIAMLRKMIPHKVERTIYACMVIIAANAGGSFSPIGDVTTILLWTGGNVTPNHQITTLLLPALVCMLVPLLFVTRFFKKGSDWGERTPMQVENSNILQISSWSRIVMLSIGVFTMISVPAFSEWSHLPPFVRVLTGLAILWVYCDLFFKKKEEEAKLSVGDVLKRLDISTILFFLGILMTVGAMNTVGGLQQIGDFLEANISDPLGISFVIGVMSSFVDNVALVAATQGMYPLTEVGTYAVNSEFWTFLAYCSVTGGSLLIIGSATGVTVMGVEKVPFMYYLRKFSLLALLGYVSGAAVYVLLNIL